MNNSLKTMINIVSSDCFFVWAVFEVPNSTVSHITWVASTDVIYYHLLFQKRQGVPSGQMARRLTTNQKIAGSSPVWEVKLDKTNSYLF